jgi:hypothetical protein
MEDGFVHCFEKADHGLYVEGDSEIYFAIPFKFYLAKETLTELVKGFTLKRKAVAGC